MHYVARLTDRRQKEGNISFSAQRKKLIATHAVKINDTPSINIQTVLISSEMALFVYSYNRR
jgi:hypothetical protein